MSTTRVLGITFIRYAHRAHFHNTAPFTNKMYIRTNRILKPSKIHYVEMCPTYQNMLDATMKGRQYNGQKKKDKWNQKKNHYTENLRSSVTNPTKTRRWSQVLQKVLQTGWQFLVSTSGTRRVILVKNQIQKRTSDFLLLQSVNTKMWTAKWLW